MPARSWKFHATRWFLISTLILFFSWLIGYPGPLTITALGAYSAWHIANAWRMHVWMKSPARDIPESYGIWREIFDNLRLMQKRDLDQKKKYVSVIGDFQTLTDAFPDATIAVDRDNRITWFNNTTEALLGLKNPGDFGQVVTNLLRSRAFSKWFGSRKRFKKSLTIPLPSNENIWLEISVVSFGQDQTLIILRDTTEFQNLEQIRRDLVANISHELRSPLTVILGYLELLEQYPDKEVSTAIDRMQSQASQIQVLLDDLLELSRLQSEQAHGTEENINISGVLMQLKQQGQELSKGRHTFDFQVDDNLYLSGVVADLESAFSNLIANAVKYTPDKGTISVHWNDAPEGPRLVISDTGIGIPKRDIPRLTERFYRVGSDRARQTGGSGLGLAIVKHVLNAHEATLLIESELGEGSQFSCQFPASRRRKPGDSGE